jgi:hypothetical protein
MEITPTKIHIQPRYILTRNLLIFPRTYNELNMEHKYSIYNYR